MTSHGALAAVHLQCVDNGMCCAHTGRHGTCGHGLLVHSNKKHVCCFFHLLLHRICTGLQLLGQSLASRSLPLTLICIGSGVHRCQASQAMTFKLCKNLRLLEFCQHRQGLFLLVNCLSWQLAVCRYGSDALDQGPGRPTGAGLQSEPPQHGGSLQERCTCAREF